MKLKDGIYKYMCRTYVLTFCCLAHAIVPSATYLRLSN
jgi:hypothetical protein